MPDGSARRKGFDWRSVRVGVLIIVALLLLAYAVFQVGRLFDVFADRYPLVTLVTTTTGLTEGAPVTLAGKRVGQVEEIEFLPVDERVGGNNLALTLSIDEEVRENIREDSEARIQTQGLMGEKYVNITPGSLPWPALDPGDTIPSRPPVDVDLVLGATYDALLQAQEIMTDVEALTTRLRRGEGTLGQLLTNDTLYRQLAATTARASVLLRQINQGEGTLGLLIRDPGLYFQLQAALARVDSLGAVLVGGEGTLGRLIRSDTLYNALIGVVAQAGATVARADTTILGVQALVEGLADGDGTVQRFLTDPELYDQFLRAVVELQNLIIDIRRRPIRYRPEINLDIF